MKQNVIVILGLILFLGCSKPDCGDSPNSVLEIEILNKNNFSYPQLPENTYVIGNIGSIYSRHTTSDFELLNEQITVNGESFNGSNYDVFKLGKNIVESKIDCRRLSKKGKAFECPCSLEQSTARKEIEVIDTERVWVKSITYWKNFNSPRPDIYLIVNNWGKKSGVSWNYSLDRSGNKVWNIDDTFTISKSHFNLSITAWDDDRIGKSEKVLDYFIPQDEFQDWSQDTLTYYKNGGVSLVIEKL